MELNLEEKQQIQIQKQTTKPEQESSKEFDLEKLAISYAAMPIRQTWKNERGQEGKRILAYVIAPCYIVEVQEDYKTKDATELSKFYKVVFTWSQDGQDNIEPIYENGKCINATPVTEVFGDPKKCQDFVNRKNAKLLRKKTINLFEDEVEAVKKVFIRNAEKWRAIAYKHLSEDEIAQINSDDGNSI